MRRDGKQTVVSEVKDMVTSAKVIVRTDLSGVTVEGLTALRRKIREASGKYRVVKNTLATRAFEAPEMESFREGFHGPSAFAFGFDDESAVGVCKALKDFAKDHKKFEIKDGWLNGRQVTVDEISQFAELPPRDQLLSMLLGVMQSPIRNLVTVLAAPLRNLALTVKAIADQKDSQ